MSQNQLPGCCGVVVVSDFNHNPDEEDHWDFDRDAPNKTWMKEARAGIRESARFTIDRELRGNHHKAMSVIALSSDQSDLFGTMKQQGFKEVAVGLNSTGNNIHLFVKVLNKASRKVA